MSQNKEALIADLRSRIDRACSIYYSKGMEAAVDDAVYEKWLKELRNLCPNDERFDSNYVGYKTAPDNMLTKAKHSYFMGSLTDAMTDEDFKAFDTRVGGGPYYGNLKIDGASLRLYYKDGKLVQAITRGDGEEGDDVTSNALKFANLPINTPTPFTGSVRGEAVLYVEDWQELDPDLLGNPRNIGSGILQRSNGTDSERLRFMAFSIDHEDPNNNPNSEDKVIQQLRELGFGVCNGHVLKDINDVFQFHQMTRSNRSTMKYWIDGVVIKVNDIERQKKIGYSGKRPKGQVAFKFPAEEAVTVIRELVVTVGGTGAIVPTARFDTVRLGGTDVSNALLCNYQMISDMNIAIGDKVTVIKAGDIIPRITGVIDRPDIRKPIFEPRNCPVCNSSTRRRKNMDDEDGVVTECSNDDCPARSIGNVKRFIKSLDIKGIGDTVLEGLFASKMVSNAADLFLLDENELATLKCGNTLGAKRARSILEEIDKRRVLTIDQFMGSLGIEQLGKGRVKNIREAVAPQMDTVKDWLSGKLVDIKVEAGVPGIAEVIHRSIKKNKSLIDDMVNKVGIQIVIPKAKAATTPSGGKLAGKVYCLTGTMSRPRKEIAADIEAAGGIVKDDVVSGTILVQADKNSVSSKSKKANKNGCEIISEDELMEMIK